MNKVLYHIYHNPRCSKSRKALEILKSNTKNYKIINYLQGSINKEEISAVINAKNISKNDLIRKKEVVFKDLKLKLKNDLENTLQGSVEIIVYGKNDLKKNKV